MNKIMILNTIKQNKFLHILLAVLLFGGFEQNCWAEPATINTNISAAKIPESQVADIEMENKATQEEIKDFVVTYALIKQYYVKPTKDSDLIKGAINGLVGSIDPHSGYLDETGLNDLNDTTEGQFVGVGMEFANDKSVNKILSVIYDSPAYKAGIISGDIITKVDGQSVIDMSLEKVVKKIRGKEGTTVNITVQRGKTSVSFNLVRKKINIKSVQFALIDDNHYVYVKITNFEKNTSNQLVEVISSIYSRYPDIKGLVLDLRDNPGGILQAAIGVLAVFLPPDSLVVYMKNRYNDIFNFYTNPMGYNLDGTQEKIMKKLPVAVKSLPMVVLINQNSASAAEIVAAALKEYHRAKILGTTSFGKGSVQQVIPLSKTTALKLTTSLYYTPNNNSVQAWGVQPDITVYSEYQDALNEYTFSENRFSKHLDNPNEKIDASSNIKIIKPAKQLSLEQLINARRKAIMPVSDWQIVVDPDLDFQLQQAIQSFHYTQPKEIK
jgi:carboxyl-terminal processing protease